MNASKDYFDAASVALSGKNLVEASAGTGKTHAITTLIVRLVIEQNLRPAEIGVVTFTEAATAELRDRVRNKLVDAERQFRAAANGETAPRGTLAALLSRREKSLASDAQRLREAAENVDQAVISTIHSFCQRMLNDSALATQTSFAAQLVPDLDDLRDDVLYDFWHRRVAPDAPLVDLLGKLEINLDRFRSLFKEICRNPNVRIQPANALLPPDHEQQLAAALERVRQNPLDVEFDQFFKRRLGKVRDDATSRNALFLGANNVVTGRATEPPKYATRLYPAVVAAALECGMAKLPPFFAAWEQYVRLYQQLQLQPAMAIQHELLAQAYQEFAARKTERGVVGFDDLIQRLAIALRQPEGAHLAARMRAQFKAVLVDEFQDTDPTQLQVFDTVFGDGKHLLFYIGDPKQAIYAFRGGDVFTYLAGKLGAQPHSMGVNWRSDPGVVNVVNQLFSGANPFIIDDIQYSPVAARAEAKACFVHPSKARSTAFEILFPRRKNSAGVVNKGRGRSDAARIVAADIVELLRGDSRIGERRVHAGDIAVLTRNNKQCLNVQAELIAHGVHCVLAGDQNVFGSEDATDLQLVLGAVLDPGNPRELRRALASRMVGLTASSIARLEQDPLAWNTWAANFRHWGEQWSKHGFMRMFRDLLATAKSAETLLATRGGERALTNLLHLGELLHRASKEQHLGPAALAQWLREERGRTKEGTAAQSEYAEIRLESDESAVQILTIHKAKGLEYSIVYCPYLWDGFGGTRDKLRPLLYHDRARQAVLDITLDVTERDVALAQHAKENEAEERRVVYVGLTRAKHRCTVLWGGFKDADKSAAAGLLHPSLADWDEISDAQLLTDLDSLVKRCGGDLQVHSVDWMFDRDPLEPEKKVARPLRARRIHSKVAHWARTDSFSGLVKPRGMEDLAAIAPAFDEALLEPAALIPATVGSTVVLADRPRDPILLLNFPGGARSGDFFHKVFELIDFSLNDTALRHAVREQFDAFAIAKDRDETTRESLCVLASAALRSALDTQLLPDSPLRLRDVPMQRRFSELSFHVPVQGTLTPRKLAGAFSSAHASAELPEDYHTRVAKLPFAALDGFLNGVIDLVFEHESKWYVVDYKSNYLGDFVDDYSALGMSDKMAKAHYFLQYHLYALGVHRFLKQWQPGYKYAEHFGGVLYLFIKGMRPMAGSRTGIFFEKPPEARIHALSEVFGEEAVWR